MILKGLPESFCTCYYEINICLNDGGTFRGTHPVVDIFPNCIARVVNHYSFNISVHHATQIGWYCKHNISEIRCIHLFSNSTSILANTMLQESVTYLRLV